VSQSGTFAERTVVVLDMRKHHVEVCNGQWFTEVEAQYAARAASRQVDLRRVLVLDDAARLEEHGDAYESLLTSRRVETALCLAVGPLGAAEKEPPTLRRPFVLQPPQTATLWVGDLRGIGWSMGDRYATTVSGGGQGPGVPGTAPEAGPDSPWAQAGADLPSLGGLLQALRIPEVFDRARDLTGGMPDAVASVGLRAILGGIDTAVLHQACVRAVDRLTGHPANGGGGGNPPDVDAEALQVLLGSRTETNPPPGQVLLPSGALERSYQQVAERIAGVRRQFRWVGRGWRGVVAAGRAGPRLPGAAAGVGSALASYRELVLRTVEQGCSRTGLDQTRLADLEQAGVRFSAVPVDAASVTTALRQVVLDGGVERSYPLDVLTARLRDLAHRVAPQGGAEYLEAAGEACPVELAQRLSNPSAFPPLAAERAALVRLLGWGLAGTAAAGGLAAGLGVPLPVLLVLLAAGAGAVAAAPRWLWSRLVRRWVHRTGVPAAARAADGLRAVLARVAAQEWLLARARRDASNTARALAAALAVSAVVLRDHAELTDPNRGPDSWFAASGAGGGPSGPVGVEWAYAAHSDSGTAKLVEVIRADLVDALTAALDPCWDQLSRGGLEDDIAAGVRRRLSGLLAEYRRHLGQFGPHLAPPFALEQGGRERADLDFWGSSAAVAELLRSTAADSRLVQLCAPEQLGDLDVEPGNARLVRFAPLLGTPSHSPDAIWTDGGQLAGVLRLVPLRRGVVDPVWLAGSEATGTGAGHPNGSGVHVPGGSPDGRAGHRRTTEGGVDD
jgi:hypothetical protein